MSLIPAGYQLHITSWENDGDYYQTKIVSGLSALDVDFIIAVLSLFKSSSQNSNCFGNRGCTEFGDKYHNNSEEAVLAAVSEVFTKYKTFLTCDLCEDFEKALTDLDLLHELIAERYLGYTESYCDYSFFFRVFDNVQVYYYPQEIKNVTNQFI